MVKNKIYKLHWSSKILGTLVPSCLHLRTSLVEFKAIVINKVYPLSAFNVEFE